MPEALAQQPQGEVLQQQQGREDGPAPKHNQNNWQQDEAETERQKDQEEKFANDIGNGPST